MKLYWTHGVLSFDADVPPWLLRLFGYRPDWRTEAYGESSRSWSDKNRFVEVTVTERLEP